MYTRVYNSVEVADTTQLKQNGVVLDGFIYLVASVLIAMFAVFNYIVTNRECADYSILRWLLMEPLFVVWGVLCVCFAVYLILVTGGYTLDRFLIICAIMVVGGLLIWSYVSKPDEFDPITPAPIPKWYNMRYIVPVMVVLGYMYFLFLGGTVRLDRMGFFSVPSFVIMASIYLMAYASMTVCSFVVDFAQSNDRYVGDFATYFFAVFAMYVVFAAVLYAVEMIVVRVFGYSTGNFVKVYNMAPLSVHDSVEATYNMISVAMFFAFFIPAVCVWMLRDNIVGVDTDDRREGVVNMSVVSAIGLCLIPFVSILLMNGVRGDYFGSWTVNLLVALALSVCVLFMVFYGFDWTEHLYLLALAVLIAVDIGVDLANKGMTGLALHYSIMRAVVHKISSAMTESYEDEQLMQYGLFSFLLFVDGVIRKKLGKTLSPVSTTFGYTTMTWFLGKKHSVSGDLPSELHGVMRACTDFAALNAGLNANFDGVEDIPSSLSILVGFMVGLVTGYLLRELKRTDEFKGVVVDGQKWAEEYKHTITEETREVKWW